MKKALSILLILVLAICPISALAGNWYAEKAIILAERMHALASDDAYINLYLSGNEDVLMHVKKLAESDFSQPIEARMLRLPDAESTSLLLNMIGMADDAELPELTEAGKSAVFERMPTMIISAINGRFGVSMVAASSVLSVGETHIMPEVFQPCVLFLQYPDTYSVAVAFSQSGEETISASATPIYTDFILDFTQNADMSLLERIGMNMLLPSIELE